MLDEIIAGKVKTVIITYKDRLSRVGFSLFTYLFKKYNCEIIVVSEVGSIKLDFEEIFEETKLNVRDDSNFNYSVWYKNGLHNVYVYYEYDTYEYEYFEEKDKIRLVEVKNKKYER